MPAETSFVKRIKRVAAMSHDEIYVRTAQAFSKHWDLAQSKIGIRTSAEDAAAPFGGRGHFFFAAADVEPILNRLRSELSGYEEETIGRAERILQHRFDLLGYESVDYGEEINWHFDGVHAKAAPRVAWFRVPYLDFRQVGDHKITWELNRHQHLATLAKAYRLSGNETFSVELFRQWYSWQRQNPYPIGINWASSLEVAFRSLSWLWAWHLLDGCSVVPKRFAFDLRVALNKNARHIERYLSTYFAPNTHLLGEAVALFFIGTLSAPSPAARRWQDLGWRVILQEAQRQVRTDGMHFEQSTYYHVYALDFFLHSRILAGLNGIAIPATFDRTVEKMLEALHILSTSGPLPRFGDDDGGRVFDGQRNLREHLTDPLATGAVLFNRADFKQAAGGICEETVWLLGETAAKKFEALPSVKPLAISSAMEASGIYLMNCSERPGQQLVVDCGPQGYGWAGHGHADALSIQLAIDGKPILIDPGTCTYVNSSGERGHFRQTACHNTVVVDGLSQADSAGAFKWEQLAEGRPERWIVGETFDFFAGSHTGYKRLANPVTHRRNVFYLKSRFWLIRDTLEGDGIHRADVCWHFAPGSVFPVSGGARFLGRDNATVTLFSSANSDFCQETVDGWYSPRYGRKEPAPVLRISSKAQLPLEFVTVLLPDLSRGMSLEAIRVYAREQRSVPVNQYHLSGEGYLHQLFFADSAGSWNTGEVASDARFAYCAVGPTGELEQFVLCDGSYLEFRGKQLYRSPLCVKKAEWRLMSRDSDAMCSIGSALPPRNFLEKGSAVWV